MVQALEEQQRPQPAAGGLAGGGSSSSGFPAPGSDAHARKLRRMEGAVRVLLEGIGERVDRQGLRDTPKRVAKALIAMTEGYRQQADALLNQALFDEPAVDAGAGGLVLVRDIDFASLSQDSLLPFYGRCHVAYVPSNGVVLGLSKLARLTKLCAKQLQTQDSLAAHLLAVLHAQLRPAGAVVVVQARHLAYTSEQPPRQQLSAAASGCLAAPPPAAGAGGGPAATLEEVLELLGTPLRADDVALLRDPAAAALGPRGCVCASGYGAQGATAAAEEGSCCLGCSGTRLAPLVLRGMSASAAAGGSCDSPRAPATPDPSEANDDTDGSEQGSDAYCQPPVGAGAGAGAGCADDAAGQLDVGESMEAALTLLLAEAGVDIAAPAVRAALQRHVLALLAATSGYHQKQPARRQRQQQQQQQQHTGGCGCCAGAGVPEQQCQLLPPPAAAQQQEQQEQQRRRRQQCYEQHEHHVPFMSQCEHHMLPFHGTVHISYLLPRGGGSGSGAAPAPLTDAEAAQLVSCFTRRLQVQERITTQIAGAVQELLVPAGVVVVIRAVHMCMVARGVENHAGSTSTRAALGAYEADPELRCAFLRSLQAREQQEQLRQLQQEQQERQQ